LTDRELSHPNFGAECSNAYISTIRTFVEQHIITPLVIIRKLRGLPDGLERGVRRDLDDHNLGRSNFLYTTPSYTEPVASMVVFDNTARVAEEQVRNFLGACRAKFVKAKIEPGTFLLARLQHSTDIILIVRVYRRSSRGAVDWRTRNTDDFENVPLCWGGVYECDSRRPTNQGDH